MNELSDVPIVPDHTQKQLVDIHRASSESRTHLVSAIHALVLRGEKLEKLAERGDDLSSYAGEYNRRASSVNSRTSRLLWTLAAIICCSLSSVLLLVCANSNT